MVKKSNGSNNKNTKVSSDRTASLASQILRDGRSGKNAKSLAASVLSQSQKGKN